MKKVISKGRLLRAAVVLQVVLLCMNCLILTAPAAENARVVRIPYGYNDFLRVDDDGNATGYYANYLAKLAMVNNWRYEYINTSWKDAVTMLSEGNIDFIFPTNYSEEREETMDFCTVPVGYTASGIFALSKSGYEYENFSSFNGARIGVAKGSSNDSELIEFAQKHGFTFEAVNVDTKDAAMEALRDGRADMAVYSAANEFPGGTLVAVMDAKPVYFAVKEGNAQLLSQLNAGMQRLIKEEPELVADAMRRTLVGNNTGSVALTDGERSFINSRKEITVGFYENSEPLAYVNDDGTYGGVYIEFLKTLKEKFSLNLVPRPISRDKSWKELIKSGEIDFYIGAADIVLSDDDNLLTTNPFLEYSNILVTRSDCALSHLKQPVIALTKGRASWADYLEDYLGTDIDVKYCRNAKECMVAVADRQADASLINNLEFNYQSKNDSLPGLIQWSRYRFATNVSLAASADADPTMISTVNKIMGMVSADNVDTIVEECLNMPYNSYSVRDYIYIARFPLLAVAFILLAAVIIAVLVLTFRRRQRKFSDAVREREQNQLRILAALSRDYSVIYYTDLDKDSCELMRTSNSYEAMSPKQKTHSGALREYVMARVIPEENDELLALCDPKEVIRRFGESDDFFVRYCVNADNGEKSTYEMHFVDASINENEHKMVLGVRCVDDIVREAQKQKQILQDALDGANRANAAKTEFLSGMSHDIRTPMNAIMGMTAIATAHADEPERVRDALTKISGASRHLLGLINNVLDMSKIDAGKLNLNEENISLPELINTFLTIVQPQVKSHQHKLTVHIQDIRHEAVIGDSLRIQQALVNLVGNAVKYTPDGGEISLTVREKPIKLPSVACYEFVVADNGIGMTKDFQKHIFEPFKRAEDLRTSKIQGTGLGLSITLNIVRMMGGNIEVESELGKGSTFTMTVFLKCQDVKDDDISDLKDLSVLVVDDDADICENIGTILGELGMRFETYTDGHSAVEAVRHLSEKSEMFDAAIIDWKMPGMNGVQTAEAIKRIEGGNLPIIILSAYDWSEIEEEARAAGVERFIPKPVFKSGIVHLFREIVNGKNDSSSDDFEPEKLWENNFAGRRVLLVEDNALNMEIAKEILEMTGLTVEEAENGQIAVDMFADSEKGYYDIILMDVQMPVMNGYDATRAIRALNHGDALRVPIIAMTANAFIDDIKDSKEAGMNEHLAKPINFEELNRILNEYLK